jgi:diaminopimelate decarboxylase
MNCKAMPTFWHGLVRHALTALRTPTPFYLFSSQPIRQAITELARALQAVPLPVRHWLSCKTQPFPPLLRWWRCQGLGIEVVSEFEFHAALSEGFSPERILVNGPAKHHWLPRCPIRGLSVNIDSASEAHALLPLARKFAWRLGVRCLTREESDPKNSMFPTQFGLAPDEAVALLRRWRRTGVRFEIVHMHLRTNVPAPSVYERAIHELAAICHAARFTPLYLDCGGGLPPPQVRSSTGAALNARFDLREWAQMLTRASRHFPGLKEVWLENGRFVLARSGVLVVQILDVKERRGLRQLICDGGRTMNALVSSWEQHDLFPLTQRRGPTQLTSVCGPTCMSFDQLARTHLPRTLRAGDHLIWMDAGAYHIPWETRFSHGLAPVLWHQGRQIRQVRAREPFEGWWAQWQHAP